MKYVVTVFGTINEDQHTPIATFGPFTCAEMKAFTKRNMGALADGYYWEFMGIHPASSINTDLAYLFIPGTRNNLTK